MEEDRPMMLLPCLSLLHCEEAEEVEAAELLKRLDEDGGVDAPNWKGGVEQVVRLDDPDELLVKSPDDEEGDDPNTKVLELEAENEFAKGFDDVIDT